MPQPRIMIVEDEVVVSTDLRVKLEKIGYHVPSIVRYGEKVVDAAVTEPPDLILMDIRLKGEMDGIQAAQQIKKDLNIPIVFLTAYTDQETVRRATNVGPFGFLTKPVRMEELQININMSLYKADMERKLSEREATYRTLFENMAQGAYSFNENLKCTDVNPAALNIFGLTRDEVLSRTPYDPHWKVVDQDKKPLPVEHRPSVVALKDGRAIRNKVLGIYNALKEDYVWVTVNAIPQFKSGQDRPYRVFVTLHDITALRSAENNLRAAKQDLENRVRQRTAELEDMNTALKVLLNQQEKNKAENDSQILANVESIIEPYLLRLKQSKLNASQRSLIDLIESNMATILSPFSSRLLTIEKRLTPTEMKVADLVRKGQSNKEIASILCVSLRTVAFHRENIRSKLDLTHEKTNLRTFLSSLE